MKIKKGITRTCFLVGPIAIKLPRIYKHLYFLQGCYSNYSERNFCKMFRNYDGEIRFQDYVAPSYFLSNFWLNSNTEKM